MDEPTAALERGRGRAAVRRRPQPARRGPRPGLHLPPLRRGLRALRHRHRDARRRVRLHRRRSPTPPSTRSSRGWSAARSATCSPRPPADVGDVVLEVSGLTSPGTFHDVSFTVRAGEIVGLAGLVGAGRSEIARAVFGVDSYDAGTVRLAGKAGPAHNPRAAIRAGIAFVPEDRRKQGLVTERSVARNVAGVIRARPDHARAAHHRGPRTGPPAPGRPGSRSRPARSTCTRPR